MATPSDTAGTDQPVNPAETAEERSIIAQADKQRKTLLRRVIWFRMTDDIDTAILSMIEPILNLQIDEHSNILTEGDIESSKDILPRSCKNPSPGFFGRISYPFSMLRSCLELHDADPVPEDFLDPYALNGHDAEDKQLHHRIWFLTFAGASATDIVSALNTINKRNMSL